MKFLNTKIPLWWLFGWVIAFVFSQATIYNKNKLIELQNSNLVICKSAFNLMTRSATICLEGYDICESEKEELRKIVKY